MGSVKDITGNNYSLLKVIKRSETTQNGHIQWVCQCSCGNMTKVSADQLKSGHTKSCGCLKHRAYNYKHGLSKNPTYHSWASMLDRCRNNKNAVYKDYGGRGIKVCESWFDFRNFINDMGLIEKGMTIERIKEYF